jgi:hypothetical protein
MGSQGGVICGCQVSAKSAIDVTGGGEEDLSQSVETQTKVNMGLWRRDATKNTCISARAYTKMLLS